MNCPHCSEALSERGVFCKACGGQAKCLNCKEVLEPGAAACVECGTKVGQPGEGARESVAQAASAMLPNRNKIIFREDKNSRSLEADLSDIALQGIGESFSGLFQNRATARPINSRLFTQSAEILDARSLPAGVQNDDAPQQSEQSPIANAVMHDQVPAALKGIEKIFHIKGETLELLDNRVKAVNLSDYVRRLTYLYLYAQELHGRSCAREVDLVELLKASKAWDKSGNSRRWLTKRVLIKDEGDDAIKLTGPGREEAMKILEQAGDPAVEDKWNPDFNKPKPRGKRKA